MTATELTERLTAIVMEQAEIIGEQASALAQLGSVSGLGARVEKAERERRETVGE